jgi:branched-chain amino acid transport system substrate-binding protein
MRWGFENLHLDEARVAALGAHGLFHSIDVTCANHEGDGMVTFQQWDGAKWNVISDWIAPDWALLRPIIEKAADQYATEKKITPRDCSTEGKS